VLRHIIFIDTTIQMPFIIQSSSSRNIYGWLDHMEYRIVFQIIIGISSIIASACLAPLIATDMPSPISAQEALGRKLFFDTALSADGKTSCASCHQPEQAYSDARPTSKGAYGRLGTRNTPSLLDVSENQPFFWDGRRQKLSQAVMDPFLHPVELALADDTDLLRHLQTPRYQKAFAMAFGTSGRASATLDEIGVALSAFVRTIPKPPTPFDRYLATHDEHILTREALDGFQLFTGKAACSQCHQLVGSPVRFSDNAFHSTGTGLQNVVVKLPTLSRQLSYESADVALLGREIGTREDIAALGRFVVTHRAGDVGLFRTPSLRYVANTAPFMHDGSVSTLAGAVDQEIYWRGLASGQPLSLTVHERGDLVAFLKAISLEDPVSALTSSQPFVAF